MKSYQVRVILNNNIPTEDYSLSSNNSVDKSHFSIKHIFVFLCLRHRQVAVDRWLDIRKLTYTEYTGPAISAINMAGVIVFSKN